MKNEYHTHDQSSRLNQFRQRAEVIMADTNRPNNSEFDKMEMVALLHELQVFQIELEMQNDELHISYNNLEIERTKFSGLYDLAPVGYFMLDKFGAVTDANITGLNMMDTVKADIVGHRFQDYVSKDQSGEFYNLLRKMRAFSTRHNCQLELSSGKGKLFYAQLEGTGILNKVSHELQFYIAVIDITRRRQAEQRLLESNERLKMTLEASGTGTWEIDLKKQYIYFDDSSYAILGFEPWEFDGKYETFFKMLHPEDRDEFRSLLLLAVKEDKDMDTEFRMILPSSGLRHIAVRGHLVHQDPDVTRFVGIIIDVTEKRRLQQEGEKLRENYQKSIVTAGMQAQENERKRISDTLHDSVAQMLYGIRLNLQGSGINMGTNEMNNVNHLLNEAITEIRNISFELAPSILNDFGLVDSVKEMAKRLTMDTFSVTVKLSGMNNRFRPDMEVSAFRIIQELVNNSMKHGNATHTAIKINMINQSVNISVTDNGHGFNLKTSDYLTMGSGLLSIKNRVNLFNGHFDIKSAPGKGTMVSVTLKEL